MMALLGLVHPAVRRDAHLRSVAVLRVAGAAAADADRKLLSVEDDRGGKRGLDALGHAGALTFVHVGADDERELIAADAEGVVPASDAAQQPRRDLLEQPVAYGVAVGVVYRLKAVELETMANTDSLTGLFNERYFSRVMNICEEKKLPFVLYYLDLDRFKPINDTYGHAMGDRLLKEISARLLRCIRSRDYAFRIGGDEFALIVSADMDEEQRGRMAERIQTMLSAPIVIEGKLLSVGVSCGCACYPEDGDASQVRITADSRMYAEKQHHHEDDRTEEQS